MDQSILSCSKIWNPQGSTQQRTMGNWRQKLSEISIDCNLGSTVDSSQPAAPQTELQVRERTCSLGCEMRLYRELCAKLGDKMRNFPCSKARKDWERKRLGETEFCWLQKVLESLKNWMERMGEILLAMKIIISKGHQQRNRISWDKVDRGEEWLDLSNF